MTDEGVNHIRRTSRRYRILFSAMIVAVPVFDLAYWVLFNHLPEGLVVGLPAIPMQPLSAPSLAIAFVVSLLPVGVVVYGLRVLGVLFRLYENGIIFSTDTVACFRRLGYALVAWVATNAAFTPLISVVLSYANPPGRRMVTAEFGVLDVALLLIGGIVLLISSVMNEGRKLEDEQAHTV